MSVQVAVGEGRGGGGIYFLRVVDYGKTGLLLLLLLIGINTPEL